MASEVRTASPTPNWLDLPLEIIDNVYRQLDDIRDIGNLRLTCTRFAKDGMRKTTQAYLYQDISFTFIQPRIEAFMRTATNCVHDSEFNGQPSATWVRKLVFEGAMPASVMDLGISDADAARRAYVGHLDEQRNFLMSLKNSPPSLYASVGRLNNLETIEYISGFREQDAPASTGELIRLLESAMAITSTYTNPSDQARQFTMELWKHKRQF